VLALSFYVRRVINVTPPASRRVVRVPTSALSFYFVIASGVLMLFAAISSGGTNVFDIAAITWFYASLTSLIFATVVP
jgi:hypothetical protein